MNMRLIRFILSILAMFVVGSLAAPCWLIPVRRWRDHCLRSVRRAWAFSLLWVFRVHVHVEAGPVNESGAALYVANHTGYLDILVLMSLAPGVFISREGVLWWPVLGQLIAAGGTLFTDRRNRLSIGRLVDKVRKTLHAGTSVLFFPEATSSNGEGLLPFKSPLFAAAVGKDGETFPIRPLVLKYRSIGGEPLDESNRDRVFWYSDVGLLEHAWGLLKERGIDVVVKALPEHTLSGNRKQFAGRLREEMLRELWAPEVTA